MSAPSGVTFVVPGNPIPWQRARSFGGARFTATATKLYQGKIRAFAHNAKVRPRQGPISVTATFHRETGQPCDVDNLAKTLLDALIGVAYDDDRQVVSLVVHKRVDRDHPRAVVEIASAA